ncbi:MAG: hypothetical protein MJ230_04500 [bacterium]|nr:hypothetical protein [bacterium]
MGKKSSQTIARTVYGKTTTTNPYVISKTDNNGTTSEFIEGTAVDSINKFVNNNVNRLLSEYLNPTLNSVTNQAKLNSFMNTLNNSSALAFENNIINPLSRRNMIRSSQATNMYSNLAQNNANQIANYAQNLISESQKDTATMLYNLMLLYMNGYNIMNDTQKQSLATSQGNSTKSGSNGNSSLTGSDITQLANQLAVQAAMMAAVI